MVSAAVQAVCVYSQWFEMDSSILTLYHASRLLFAGTIALYTPLESLRIDIFYLRHHSPKAW